MPQKFGFGSSATSLTTHNMCDVYIQYMIGRHTHKHTTPHSDFVLYMHSSMHASVHVQHMCTFGGCKDWLLAMSANLCKAWHNLLHYKTTTGRSHLKERMLSLFSRFCYFQI